MLLLASVACIVSHLPAQSILVTQHQGKNYRVVAAKEMRPYIEVDGKRVIGEGFKYALHKIPEFLPAFVKVSNLKVNTSSLNVMDSGAQINNEFHFRAHFESPYALKDVFLVLELTMDDKSESLFLYEVGALKANVPHPIGVTAKTGFPLGSGQFKFHLYSEGGLEILHSEQPFAMREAMLDRLIARRIKGRADGPPVVFFGPTPEYPPKLQKAKIPGEVKLSVRIRPNGGVLDATVVSATDPSMGEAAVVAVRQWRFFPRIKDGHPIEANAVIPIEFTPMVEAAAGR